MAQAAGTRLVQRNRRQEGRNAPNGWWKVSFAILGGLIAVVAIRAITQRSQPLEQAVDTPGVIIEAAPRHGAGGIVPAESTASDSGQRADVAAEQPETGVLPGRSPGLDGAKPPPATLRDTDFQNLPLLRPLIQSGGTIDPRSVIYFDLTKDGNDEAIVPVSSDGTYGNLAYVVLTASPDGPRSLLTLLPDKDSLRGPVVSIENGQLVESIGVYGPEDPGCCPSQVKRTVLKWSSNHFEIAREDVADPSMP